MGASDTDQAQQTHDSEQTEEIHNPDEVAVSDIKDEPKKIDVDERLEETRSEHDDGDREMTDKPDVTDEHRDKAKEIIAPYQEERRTATLPGSDNTISGTAINDWLDDDGNPKYSEDSGADSKGAESKDAGTDEKQPQEQHS